MFRTALAATLLSVSIAPVHASGNLHRYSVDFIGEAHIASGYLFEDTVVGGLSGIDYNPSTGTYVAISDDRAEPRFYTLDIDLSDGWLDQGDVNVTQVTSILDKDGAEFTTFPDPEGIRVAPFPGLLYWTSERVDGGTTPFTRVMTTEGQHLAEFALPDKFVGVPEVSGTRNNTGFESITFGKGKGALFVANESALVQDGEKSSLEQGSPARVLKLKTHSGKAKQEYIYWVDPIAKAPTPDGAFADSGLVELLRLDRDLMIAMERSFSMGAGYTIKLYLTSTRGATDVSDYDSIKGKNVRPMKKKLLLNLDELGITLDNVEGMSFGPKINGQRTLILASDDNFSAFGPQVNQFLAFTLQDHYYWRK